MKNVCIFGQICCKFIAKIEQTDSDLSYGKGYEERALEENFPWIC